MARTSSGPWIWFKQYFICSFTCKQIHTTSNVLGSDGKLAAYIGHFLAMDLLEIWGVRVRELIMAQVKKQIAMI